MNIPDSRKEILTEKWRDARVRPGVVQQNMTIEQSNVEQIVDELGVDGGFQEASNQHSHCLVLDVMNIESAHIVWPVDHHLFRLFKLVRVEPRLYLAGDAGDVRRPEVHDVSLVPDFG